MPTVDMATQQESLVIFHNPRCGKSRAALALLQERGLTPTVIEYLKTPPTRTQLKQLLRQLAMKPEALARKGEEIYKERYACRSLSDEQWIDALAEHPILIERPIVVRGDRAVVGRPPERVLDLID